MTLEEFANAKARRSVKTSESYQKAVRLWSSCLEMATPEIAIEKIKSGDIDPIQSLDKFVSYLMEKNLAPKSVGLYVTGVKGFLRYHGVKMDREELKARLVMPDQYEISVDRAFTDAEIRTLLLRGNLKAKTVLLLLLTTGCRVGELSKLKVGHLNLNADPPRVTFVASGNKTRRQRTIYTTLEAANIVRQFLGDRINQPSAWVFPHPTKTGEPESSDAHETQLRRLIKKCGLQFKIDDSSRRYGLHPHCARKTFYSKCLSAGVIPNLADAWLGHSVGLDANYLRLPEQELISEWRKVEPTLTFLSPVADPKTARETGERIRQLEAENVRLREELSKFMSDVKLSLIARNDRNEQFRAWMSIPKKERDKLVKRLLKN